MMDFQVKQDFKYKRFSRLEYLNQKESWDEDECNLGLYYFLLERQEKPTELAFKEILAIKGDHNSAYNYLGDVAFELFDEQEANDIAAHYYEQALTHSNTNSHSYWGLFRSTRDPNYFFQSVSLDYEANKFQKITDKMFIVYSPDLIKAEFSQENWKHLKSICLDSRVKHQKNLLLICYFYLEEFEAAFSLLSSQGYISKEVVQLYREYGHIDEETFLSTISHYERLKLTGTAELAYEEVKEEAKKGERNPTSEVIIKYAFEAKAYHDVIALVERRFENDKPHFSANILKLYHTLSSLYIGSKLNVDFERDINSKSYLGDNHTRDDEQSLPLYLAYQVQKNINKLNALMEKHDNLHEFRYDGSYHEIKAHLRHESLIGHYLYDSLIDSVKELRQRWNAKNVEDRLKNEDLAPEEMASLLMEKGKYLEALNMLQHPNLEPSMYVSNLRGVCFEHLNHWDAALEHSKLALDTMLSHGEKNATIISNYLYCLHKSEESINREQYESYVDLFNQSLTESFIPTRLLNENSNSLFKYYPFNKFTLDALMNGYFYLASAEQLNDPIELPYANLIKNQDFPLLQPHFRLSSFSQNENSMLMWSHYAENHTGLMIEYCFEGHLPDSVGIGKVQYLHEEERFMEKDKYLFEQYMLIKNKDWAYEKEVRLFGYKKEKIYYKKQTYPKRSTNSATAYIKSITVGYKFPESTIKLMQSIVDALNENRHKNLSKIKLRRAKLSESNFFTLEYEDIN